MLEDLVVKQKLIFNTNTFCVDSEKTSFKQGPAIKDSGPGLDVTHLLSAAHKTRAHNE